jgi:SNF2 family DNA or RNA helicase
MQRIHLVKEPPLGARLKAFSYQTEAVSAIKNLEYAAIFHEQGLGKTKIAIDLFLYWLEKKYVDTALLVVKKGLLANWQREIKLHCHIVPRIISQNRAMNYYTFNSPSRLMLTHYEVFNCEEERFKLFFSSRDVGLILDESARIKNPKTSLSKVICTLAPLAKRRIVMTGTPVANRPYDIWAQIFFLDQGNSLGKDFRQFKNDLDLNAKLAQDSARKDAFESQLDSLFGKIDSFCVRETKASGILSLPEKRIVPIVVEWEIVQKEIYTQLKNELRVVVVKEGLPKEENAEAVLKRLLRLVQIASNPKLIDESYRNNPGKLAPLLDLVSRIVRNHDKCIVWSSFTDNVDWLSKVLSKYGACRVHGKLTMLERQAALDKFMTSPDHRVLVATPASSKEGLTLTVANHVIFYDRTFSLDDYLQAQDRIHRISQEKTCYVYNMIMEDSIDEWVDVLLNSKHLAAQLAQGDISLEYYRSKMSYAFGEIIKGILTIPEDQA